MKIIVYSPYFYGYSKSIANALQYLEHTVRLIVYDRCLNSIKRKIYYFLFPQYAEKCELIYSERLLITKIGEFAPDLMLVIRGDKINPLVLNEIKEKSGSCKIIIWENDNLDCLRVESLTKNSQYIDCFFTYDRKDVKRAESIGFKKSYYLPTGFDPFIFQKILPTNKQYQKYGCDITFVGKGYDKRNMYLKQIPSEVKLKVFGTGYQKGIKADKSYIILNEVNILYNCSKIGLSMHENDKFQGVNNRTFEICGSGCICLVDNMNEIPEMFDVGKEVVMYSSPLEMIEQIERYSHDKELRLKIAEAGNKNAHAHHTFRHRLERMLNIIGD
jgi:spore maturation protein CgeB